MRSAWDAVVVGSGPNGLAAAITIAEAGHSVLVVEAEATIGGGARTQEITVPGFWHDLCSAVHPMAAVSPCFRKLPLADHGLEWIYPDAAVAHPLDDGTAVTLERSVDDTAARLGVDGPAYRRLMSPLVSDWNVLERDILGPLRLTPHPLRLSRFGLRAIRSAESLLTAQFKTARARALLAGVAAHAILPLEKPPSASVALVLSMVAHVNGWPFPCRGAQAISNALAAHLISLGGEIQTGRRIEHLDEVPAARAVLCDITPRQLLRIAGDSLPAGYRRSLSRYRYGPGAFKVDWALNGPIPWRAPDCSRAATVHIGGTMEEIAVSERDAWDGRCSERPFVLLAQPSLFDPSRAPAGCHTGWAYCHVPNGSDIDMTDRIERQVERFAPGFRDRIVARTVMPPAALERKNANLVGGDITGGAQTLAQLFTRPTFRMYGTPHKGLYLCSSSTPPGAGVHGMCGYFAASAALKACFE